MDDTRKRTSRLGMKMRTLPLLLAAMVLAFFAFTGSAWAVSVLD